MAHFPAHLEGEGEVAELERVDWSFEASMTRDNIQAVLNEEGEKLSPEQKQTFLHQKSGLLRQLIDYFDELKIEGVHRVKIRARGSRTCDGCQPTLIESVGYMG
jgi:hypothetical protein